MSHLNCIEIRLRVTRLALLHFQCAYGFWACGDLSTQIRLLLVGWLQREAGQGTAGGQFACSGRADHYSPSGLLSCVLRALFCSCHPCPAPGSALLLPREVLPSLPSVVPRSHSPCHATSWELLGSLFMSLKVSCPHCARADLVSLIQPYFQAFCMVSCS